MRGIGAALSAARDLGVVRIPQIAQREAGLLGLSEEVAVRYLRQNLHFHLGAGERQGLAQFRRLAAEMGLVRPQSSLLLEEDRPRWPIVAFQSAGL